MSTFRTWLLFWNSPYKCHLVYARGEISLDYLSGTNRLIFFVMEVPWKRIFWQWLRTGFLSMIFGHRIKESPPRFKMMNHSRVGRTSGGTALLINYSLLTSKSRCWRESVGNGLWTVDLVNLWSWLFIGYRILLKIRLQQPHFLKNSLPTWNHS